MKGRPYMEKCSCDEDDMSALHTAGKLSRTNEAKDTIWTMSRSASSLDFSPRLDPAEDPKVW